VIDYFMKNEKKGGVDFEAYVKDCGIGIKLSEEDVKKVVD
jgi:hypothetical protein